jgi:hypothetical protein
MDYNFIVSESFEYTKDALWEKWGRWTVLLAASILFPVFMGYSLRIYRGESPAPEPENWGRLFIDGIRLCIILLVYQLPIIIATIIAGFFLFPFVVRFIHDVNPLSISAFVAVFGSALLIILILSLVIYVILTIGIVRFARMDRIVEAFSIREILRHIQKIGWGDYILALTVLWIFSLLYYGTSYIVGLIPFIGWIFALFLMPVWGIYSVRFITHIYDVGEITQ